ncbi:MAG: glycosyltransferase [Gemmataceae bacterium]|nr:glycosyltransferase [Gemmataceae bacterium]
MIDELAAAGTESQLVALIRHLDPKRVQPCLCLLRGEETHSRALEPDGCPVLRLGVRSLCHWTTPFKMRRLIRFLVEQRIDVFQVYFPDSTYLGVPAARLAGVHSIVRTRNNLGYGLTPLHRWLIRLCNCFVDVVLTNCQTGRRALLSDEGLPADTAVVLENGVDLSRFLQIPIQGNLTGRRCVGMVANLRPVKNPELLVRAAADVCRLHPGVTFRIAGEGELRPRLEGLIQEHGLAGRFVLPGSVADVPAFLAGLDVAVLCSRSEGMSNALLEYMAAGRPIVATAVGGNAELIEPEQHGLLVPEGDQTRLAQAIDWLLRDPGWAARLGTAARRRAWERYGREAMVRRFEAFYLGLTTPAKKKILGSRSRQTSGSDVHPKSGDFGDMGNRSASWNGC